MEGNRKYERHVAVFHLELGSILGKVLPSFVQQPTDADVLGRFIVHLLALDVIGKSLAYRSSTRFYESPLEIVAEQNLPRP